MSHAQMQVRFNDGLILFGEYNGTSDVAISHLYATAEEVSVNWRKHEWLRCSCGNMEPVVIWADYGSGFYFEGTACRTCKSVHHTDAQWYHHTDQKAGEPVWFGFDGYIATLPDPEEERAYEGF